MKKRWILLCALLVVSAACAVRIAMVNHADWLEAYAAKTVIYEEGAEVPLLSENYFFTGEKNLEGYTLRVDKTELIPTETLLAQYGMTLDDLTKLKFPGMEDKVDMSVYEYVYIVTASFWNQDFENNQKYTICLMDHPVVGPDYLINADMGGVLAIPGFNEDFRGITFGIKSDRVVTLRIPYLINTRSESAISIDYLLSTSPRLLIASYPDEVYLELPTPEILA